MPTTWKRFRLDQSSTHQRTNRKPTKHHACEYILLLTIRFDDVIFSHSYASIYVRIIVEINLGKQSYKINLARAQII